TAKSAFRVSPERVVTAIKSISILIRQASLSSTPRERATSAARRVKASDGGAVSHPALRAGSPLSRNAGEGIISGYRRRAPHAFGQPRPRRRQTPALRHE